MSRRQNQSEWQAPEPFLWILIRNNLPVLIFFALAASGMLAVYWFFSPVAAGGADAIAVAGDGQALAAPIAKKVPPRPVMQRFTQTPGPLHIAIIAGHMDHDAGAVCEDGLTEADVNLRIAHKVVDSLQVEDIPAEVYAEFDPRLQGYSGTALVSIHADSCEYVNELATGYKISGSSQTNSSQLSTCLQAAYQEATGLLFHANTITADMTNYHAFREIAPGVPAVIIETGFMNLDRELLTARADVPAEGITRGILCFLESRNAVAVGGEQ